MTFEYLTVNWGPTGRRLGPIVPKTVGLFFRERRFTGSSILPPLYILFLMYVTSYRSLTTEEKDNYAIFQDLMNIFDITLFNIANSPTPPMMTDAQWDQDLDRFSRYFSNKFPNSQPFQRVPRPLIMSGGATSRSQQPYYVNQQPYYVNQQPYYVNQQPYNRNQQPYNRNQQPYNRNQQPYYAKNMVNKSQDYDPSKLAYSINIYMELYPGKSIPKDELTKLQCSGKWNAVRKAWSDFTGKPYVIKPVYSMLDKNKTQNNKNVKNVTNVKKNYGSKTRRKFY